MKMNQKLFCLLFVLTFSSGQLQSENIRFKKCCQMDQIFDKSSLSCLQKLDDKVFSNLTLLPEKLFNVDSFEDDASHNISLRDFSIGMANCETSKVKVLKIGQNYKVTNEGKLASVHDGAYESSLDLGDFCLDFSINKNDTINKVALICDPCQADGRFCVKSCCPLSMLYADGECVDRELYLIPETGLKINLKSTLSMNQLFKLLFNQA